MLAGIYAGIILRYLSEIFVTPLTSSIFVPSLWWCQGTSCGDGVAARPVSCPSGTEADCAFTPRPLDRKNCRNITGGGSLAQRSG